MAEGSNPRNVVTWILSILLAALFFFAGAMKLSGAEQVAAAFGNFGYPVWFAYLIGLIEVGCALLLLSPRTAPYAAGVLLVLMLGAIFSHLRASESPVGALVVAVVIGVVIYLRRPRPQLA